MSICRSVQLCDLQMLELTWRIGALSGSEFVNEQFLDWLKGHSLYQAKLEQSGLSEYAFLREAAAAFEKKKLEFSPSHTAQIRILIEAGEEEWVVKLSQYASPLINLRQ